MRFGCVCATMVAMSDLSRTIESHIRTVSREAQRIAAAIDWRLDPVAGRTRMEFFALREALKPLFVEGETPPKVLQLHVGGKDYVSTRRMEGNNLCRFVDEADPYESQTAFEIHKDLVPPGGIGVLAVSFDTTCLNDELVQHYNGWEFEQSLLDGIPYNPNDWKVGTRFMFVKHVGQTFYRLGNLFDMSLSESDKFDQKDLISKIQPDKDGNLLLLAESEYTSEPEQAVRREWHTTRDRFYTLMEGKTNTTKRPGLPIATSHLSTTPSPAR